jgi:hypothetical protein
MGQSDRIRKTLAAVTFSGRKQRADWLAAPARQHAIRSIALTALLRPSVLVSEYAYGTT